MDTEEYQSVLGVRFHDPTILERALTHSSCCRENGLPPEMSYERLEFLGDAYLDAFISKELYERRVHITEGSLTKLRAEIVCERSLAEIATRLRIPEFLLLGNGEEHSGGRRKPSILADVVESTLAAILLDQGPEEAERFVAREFESTVERALSGSLFMDYKTKVQEILQRGGSRPVIRYVTEAESGPDHCKTFRVRLECNGVRLGSGTGGTKKEAQQNAAKDALETGRVNDVL